VVTQVSCKLINSLLNYSEKQGASFSSLFEFFDGPEEFLRDPHFWIEINQAEHFFTRAARFFGDPSLGTTVGSQVVELLPFGALDNVFKMMPATRDYYNNLGRFFSYFLAPMVDFREKEHGSTWIRFQFPFVGSEFPHVSSFLRAVLENLPRYTGNVAAQTEWNPEANELFLTWDTPQASLFVEEPGQVVNPRLIQTLSAQLEASERALHSKNREVLALKTEVDQVRFELQNQMREKIYSEKMTGLAHLAAGVAHEINNPLSFVMSNLGRFEEYFQRLEKYIRRLESGQGESDDIKNSLDIDFILSETPAMLTEASEGLKRVKEIVKDLSSLAHPQENRTENKILADLNGILESSLKVFQEEMGNRIRVEKVLDLKTPVNVFPVRMSQVFMNLLSNAIHAISTEREGIITVRTRQEDDSAVVEIADTGTGMDESVMARLFTPFFTTKEVGKGTGLGLSIAQSIVDMHKGKIRVKSEKGKGSRFTVTIPLREPILKTGVAHV